MVNLYHMMFKLLATSCYINQFVWKLNFLIRKSYPHMHPLWIVPVYTKSDPCRRSGVHELLRYSSLGDGLSRILSLGRILELLWRDPSAVKMILRLTNLHSPQRIHNLETSQTSEFISADVCFGSHDRAMTSICVACWYWVWIPLESGFLKKFTWFPWLVYLKLCIRLEIRWLT